MSRNKHIGILFGASLLAIIVTLFIPPMAQDPNYHNLADRRMIAGVPNFFDVASNAAFLLVGVLGLWQLVQIREERQV